MDAQGTTILAMTFTNTLARLFASYIAHISMWSVASIQTIPTPGYARVHRTWRTATGSGTVMPLAEQ